MHFKKLLVSVKQNRHLFLPLVASIFLLSVYVALNGGGPFTTDAQTGTTVTFGSVGDMGSSSNANGVLSAVKSANLNFFLHVGDLSYNTQGSPQGWGTWVKGIVGAVFPYEIVSGNHDSSQISSFVAGLPDHMQSSGTYGQNYYFDYPQTTPLVRVIMISPGLFAPNTTWLGTAIDSARAKGIKWVVAGNHLNAISTGAKGNSLGTLFAFLISKKVDLILQGHDHNYQRTKQLSCVTIGSTNQSCIANPGPNYKKDAGTVLVIDGTGGSGFYTVNQGDSEAGYFAKINSDTYGFTKITLTATQLQEQFVRTGGGSLSDSFTISSNGVPVTQPSGGPVPSAACLGSCPNGNVPSPISGGPANPSTTVPHPSQTVSGSPAPSVAPKTNPSGGKSKKKKHKKTKGGIQQLIQSLLNLLKQLLQLLQKISG